MKNKYSTILFSLSLLTWAAQAQTYSDALRYSQLESGATARTVGIGGGIGALGADFATLSSNPAGLAVFRSSELVFTPALQRAKVTGTLKGDGNVAYSDQKNRFSIANVGVVLATKPKSTRWKTFNIGIGTNCLASFAQNSYYEGSSKSSVTDRFVAQANAGDFSQFEAGLANEALAIYKTPSGTYVSDFTGFDGAVMKKQSISMTGGINELDISFAGNYKDKLMIGATLGIPLVGFSEQKTYEEIDPTDKIPLFNSLKYEENLTTSGAGINLKLGLIYRASQAFRLGFAVHTPTIYNLKDNYSSTLTYAYTENGQVVSTTKTSPDGSFNYQLNTPLRLIGSIGYIVGKRGFLSGEVEFVDYTASTFSFAQNTDKDYEREINNDIINRFRSTANVRVGGELVFDILRLRGGVGLSGSPYLGDTKVTPIYSLGAGIRESSFYIDLAYQHRRIKEGFKPYLVSNPDRQPIVDNVISNNNFILTFGYRF